jgi:hypothetical protein
MGGEASVQTVRRDNLNTCFASHTLGQPQPSLTASCPAGAADAGTLLAHGAAGAAGAVPGG